MVTHAELKTSEEDMYCRPADVLLMFSGEWRITFTLHRRVGQKSHLSTLHYVVHMHPKTLRQKIRCTVQIEFLSFVVYFLFPDKNSQEASKLCYFQHRNIHFHGLKICCGPTDHFSEL